MDEGLVTFLQLLPGIVFAWFEEEKVDIEKITGVSLKDNVVRDYEREEAEDSKWCYWKPGKVITVIVTCENNFVKEKEFDRQAWRKSLNKKSGS